MEMRTPLVSFRACCFAAALAATSACGKSSSSPSSPSNPSPQNTRPTNLTASIVSYTDQSMRFGWSRPNESDTYVIEIGNAPATTSLTINTGVNGDFKIVENLPAGEQFARVRAQSSSGLSEPSNEVRFFIVDFRDFVEAVFLGTGPSRTLLETGCGNKFPGPQCTEFLLSYPRGTTVHALAWSGLAASNLDATRAMLQQISQATEGALNTTFDLTDQSFPLPGTNEITFGLKTADSQCGGSEACVEMTFVRAGIARSTAAVFSASFASDPRRTASFAHEAAHGLLGMRHVNSDSVGGDQGSIMSTRPGGTIGLPSALTALDVEATRFVYRAGLGAGSSRGELRAAGAIK